MANHNLDTMRATDEAMPEQPLNDPKKTESQYLEQEENDPTKKIFPFFQLSPELRDAIYDECLEDHPTLPDLSPGLHLQAHNVPVTALLLINKVFANDYRLRANRQQCLTITDECPIGDLEVYSQGNFNIPTRALSFSTIYLETFILNDSCMESHNAWIPVLIASLPAVRKLHLRIILGRDYLLDYFEEFETDVQSQESLTGVPFLASYKCYMRSKTWQGFEDCRKVIFEWDEGTGEVELGLGLGELDGEIEEASNYPFGEDGEDSDDD